MKKLSSSLKIILLSIIWNCLSAQSPSGRNDIVITTKPACYMQSNGSIDIVLNNNKPTDRYTINWMEVMEDGSRAQIPDWPKNNLVYGANTEDLKDRLTGHYTVYISKYSTSSQEICESAILNIFLEEQEKIELDEPEITPICAGPGTILFEYSFYGKQNEYTYAWTNGVSTLNNPSIQTSGIITLLITDNLGCESTISYNVIDNKETEIVEIPTPTVTKTCSNNGNIIFEKSITGGKQPYNISWSNGSNEMNQFDLNANEYTLYVTDINGCRSSRTYSTVYEDFYMLDIKKECGSRKGELNITFDELSFNSDWNYPFPIELLNLENNHTETKTVTSSSNSFTNLIAGTYELKLILNQNCIITKNLSIDNDPFVNVKTVDHPIANKPECNGDSNGKLFLEIKDKINNQTQPNSNYYFKWDDGSTHHFRNNLSQGTYCLTVTNLDNTCQTEACFPIINMEFSINLSQEIDPTACENTDGMIEVAGSNLGYTYEYLWNNGSTSNINSELSTGLYCVTVTSEEICTLMECYEIGDLCCQETLSLDVLPIPGIQGGSGYSTGKLEFTPSGGSGNYSISCELLNWLTGVYEPVIYSNNTISNAFSGIYLISLKDLNTNCLITKTVTLLNNICDNNLSEFDIQQNSQTFLHVPYTFQPWDSGENCTSSKYHSFFVYGSSQINYNFPLKIECTTPPGAKVIPYTQYEYSSQIELPTGSLLGWFEANRLPGLYQLKLTDGCGYTRTENYETCLPCKEPEYINTASHKHFVVLHRYDEEDFFGIEIKKPCNDKKDATIQVFNGAPT